MSGLGKQAGKETVCVPLFPSWLGIDQVGPSLGERSWVGPHMPLSGVSMTNIIPLRHYWGHFLPIAFSSPGQVRERRLLKHLQTVEMWAVSSEPGSLHPILSSIPKRRLYG